MNKPISECIGQFDEATHRYTLGGRPLVSVTQVLTEVLQPIYWGTTEWHLQRGRAVHHGCALVARKKEFTADPRIEGHIAACRKFHTELVGDVWEVERIAFSGLYGFAGTVDLICTLNLPKLGKTKLIVDFKNSLTPLVEPQLGGYSILDGGTINHGVGVQLREDGRYQLSPVYELRKARNEFLALLTTYKIKARMNLLTRTKSQDENAKQEDAQ